MRRSERLGSHTNVSTLFILPIALLVAALLGPCHCPAPTAVIMNIVGGLRAAVIHRTWTRTPASIYQRAGECYCHDP